jgi:hypothetical protein
MAVPKAVSERRPGFFRTLWIAVRAVFHETTGTLFFLLALSWLNATVRLWQAGSYAPWICAAAASFAVLLIAFGVTSFRAARRVR